MIKVFLAVRVLHMLMGALWLGGVAVMAFFLGPALDDAGPEGGKVMAGLERHKFLTYFPIVAGLSVLSGLWLIWRFTNGDFAKSSFHMFATGGVLGLTAAIIGGSVVGRTANRLVALGKQAAAVNDAQQRAALVAQMGPLKARMKTSWTRSRTSARRPSPQTSLPELASTKPRRMILSTCSA
jgi:hypothetical protein